MIEHSKKIEGFDELKQKLDSGDICKVLIINKGDCKSTKELIKKISYARIQDKIAFVELDDYWIEQLEKEKLITHWNEKSPGAIIYRSTIAGVCIIKR